MNEDLTFARNQLAAARNEIKNLRQQLVSMKHAYKKDVDEIKQLLQNKHCDHCQPRASTSSSFHQENTNSEPIIESQFRFIGYIETGFSNKRGLPRQPGILSQSQGILRFDNTILTNPDHALEGLDQYSHMWILFYFHANHNTHVKAKVAPPRLNGIRTGVFATRSPHRPSPIGLSLVKIEKIEDDSILFSGVDMIDGTPVLDIKPYIPQYDMPYQSNLDNYTNLNSIVNDNSFITSRNLQWERLPRESDGRSEDGDSILQDQSDTDFDFQDRLLVGEASQSSNVESARNISPIDPLSGRVLDGRDSDDVFSNDLQNTHVETNYSEQAVRSPIRSTSQREAPEGREGSSPPSPGQSSDNIRVANWISDPIVPRLEVQFSNDVLSAIQRITENAETASQLQSAIRSVLSEDPRSVYIRNRHPNEQFTCIIERTVVTCRFDDISHVCLVTRIEQTNINN